MGDGLENERQRRQWRQAVGGFWDEIGKLQFDYLVAQGLANHHHLLDVGCGCLRGGVHFIRYLKNGRYCGIDKDPWLLDSGRDQELAELQIESRQSTLVCRDDFDFSVFATEFDFAIAQSLFTHLSWNSILRCLFNMQKVLKPSGRFFATFFEDHHGTHKASPIESWPDSIVTYPDRDPYHYEFSVFAELADRVGLEAEYIGAWNHPRSQNLMVFHRATR